MYLEKLKLKNLLSLQKLLLNLNLVLKKFQNYIFFHLEDGTSKVDKGILIKLPERNLLKTLNLANKITMQMKIFKNDKVIDLRIYNRMSFQQMNKKSFDIYVDLSPTKLSIAAFKKFEW